jgi:hypothetical protein
MAQPLGKVAIVRKKQHALGVEVQTPDRAQRQVLGQQPIHQRPILGVALGAQIANGLVQQQHDSAPHGP